MKNVVTRALGGGPSVSPDLQELVFSIGDRYLFCSDGLTTMVSDEEIRDNAASVSKPQPLCQKLVDIANEKGGVDNITVVVVDIVDAAADAETPAPAAAEAITEVGGIKV